MNICKICKHDKDLHQKHIAPDHTGQKITHVNCRYIVKRNKIDLHDFGISSIGVNCSCHGVKPNTLLKNAIKKYQKHLKTLDPKLSKNLYARKELKAIIKRFKNDIKENPENLLHWELEVKQD